FFQAEDGIRDFHVTGVQTCALPISTRQPMKPPPSLTRMAFANTTPAGKFLTKLTSMASFTLVSALGRKSNVITTTWRRLKWWWEIGRASCRERGEGAEGEEA